MATLKEALLELLAPRQREQLEVVRTSLLGETKREEQEKVEKVDERSSR